MRFCSIKNKVIYCIIFIPVLLILFYIITTNIGEIKYNRIYKTADYISQNYNENNFEDIMNNIKIVKGMQIINENDEIIIIYKDLIYFVNRGRFLDIEYNINKLQERNENIKNKKELIDYILNGGNLYLDF